MAARVLLGAIPMVGAVVGDHVGTAYEDWRLYKYLFGEPGAEPPHEGTFLWEVHDIVAEHRKSFIPEDWNVFLVESESSTNQLLKADGLKKRFALYYGIICKRLLESVS